MCINMRFTNAHLMFNTNIIFVGKGVLLEVDVDVDTDVDENGVDNIVNV